MTETEPGSRADYIIYSTQTLVTYTIVLSSAGAASGVPLLSTRHGRFEARIRPPQKPFHVARVAHHRSKHVSMRSHETQCRYTFVRVPACILHSGI